MTSHYLVPLTCFAVFLTGESAHAQMRDYWSMNPREVAREQRAQLASADPRNSPTRKSFDALDTDRRGYLTRKDAKRDDWTQRNFDRCNISHDGHLSEVEYTNCPD